MTRTAFIIIGTEIGLMLAELAVIMALQPIGSQ